MAEMEDLGGLDEMDLEGLDLEEEGGEEDGDLEAFDEALETASSIFHRRMDVGGGEEEMGPPPAKPEKFKPGMSRPKVSFKK